MESGSVTGSWALGKPHLLCTTSRADERVVLGWHEGVPVRRNDHDPEVVAAWERHRRRFGARLRELRLEAGLTQEALALESGLSRNQIIEVEWGRSTVAVERIFDLAAAIEVDPAALLEQPSTWPAPAVHRGGRRRRQRTRPESEGTSRA